MSERDKIDKGKWFIGRKKIVSFLGFDSTNSALCQTVLNDIGLKEGCPTSSNKTKRILIAYADFLQVLEKELNINV